MWCDRRKPCALERGVPDALEEVPVEQRPATVGTRQRPNLATPGRGEDAVQLPVEPGTAADRCSSVATAIVTPGTKIDGLGRSLESFESYPVVASMARLNSQRRFIDVVPPQAPQPPPEALISTTYDGAGRPVLVESRLSMPTTPDVVKGAAQHSYRIVPETPDRLARFEALSLSPRCTVSAVWSDARGLRRMVFEDQERFYPATAKLPLGNPPIGQDYIRDYDKTRGFCAPIDTMAGSWAEAAQEASVISGVQPARVSYTYDPPQQLTNVDSPLDGTDRARTAVRFDLLGRTREMQEPNSGCTRYDYDGLNALISETGFRHEGSPDFNPIEMAFSKLKAFLRKAAERSIPGLRDAIGHLIDLIAPKEAANFFAATAFEPD
jgi:hypothetical protein